MFTLEPRNGRFKRLIHDHGKQWILLCLPRPMQCFAGAIGVTARPANNPAKLSNFRLDDITIRI